MTTLTYDPPAGELRKITSSYELHDIILKSRNSYWLAGSGDASLTFKSRLINSEMGIAIREDIGVLLTYTLLPKRKLFVAIRNDDFRDKVSLFSGGDFVLFPKAFFLSRELAWEIVKDFCASGSMPSQIQWRPYLEIDAFRKEERELRPESYK